MGHLGLEAQIEGLGDIYIFEGPFDQALESLRNVGIANPISARELAYARMKSMELLRNLCEYLKTVGGLSGLSHKMYRREEHKHIYLQYEELERQYKCLKIGSFTREGFIFYQGKPTLMALESPLLDINLARLAVEANRKYESFSIEGDELYNKYREIAEDEKNKPDEEKTVIVLPRSFRLPGNSFDITKDVARFLFKEHAEAYYEFCQRIIGPLLRGGCYLLHEETVRSKKATFITQCFDISSSDYYGDFFIEGNLANESGIVRGLLEKKV